MTTTPAARDEPTPCKHGRNFCMECHYDPKAPRSTLPEMYDALLAKNTLAESQLAELRAELNNCRIAYGMLRVDYDAAMSATPSPQ